MSDFAPVGGFVATMQRLLSEVLAEAPGSPERELREQRLAVFLRGHVTGQREITVFDPRKAQANDSE